jgi:hypothetical protein
MAYGRTEKQGIENYIHEVALVELTPDWNIAVFKKQHSP